MEGTQIIKSSYGVSDAWRTLDLPNKTTLIRVRWPFTIVCAYLLLYSQNQSLSPAALQGFVLLYLLSNLTLYFLNDELFESFYFFTALLTFDTLFLTASLAASGAVNGDFFIVCFATIFLCCICRDLRGLIGVAILSPLLYGYFLLRSAVVYEPTIYLQVIFPFVISLFYGYFAQVERLQIKLKKETELAKHTAELYGRAQAQALENASLVETLRQNAKLLEKANRVKDEFLGVMSHELRTPLNVVVGYAGLLKDRVLGDISPTQAEAVAEIMNKAQDQLTMITDILEVARIEAGEDITRSQEIDMTDLLDDLKSHYDVPPEKEVTLAWNYPADLPVVKTDGEKLKHILQNIINNAFKFTHRGAVTISVQSVPDGEVIFRIADTGVGMPEEHLSYIFDRFRQIDSSDTRLYGGVGMGLYIVKKFADMLGARIQVTSAPGKGSTFTLILPAK